MQIFNRILSVMGCFFPYALAGISAPFIFKYAPTPLDGGHWAGGLFVFAQVWALYLVFSHDYKFPVKLFFVLTFPLNTLFWAWRFFNTIPINEVRFLGMSGGAWHGMLTGLYLIGGVALIVSEVIASKVKLISTT